MGDAQVGCTAILMGLKRSNQFSVAYLCPAKGNPKFSTWGGITRSTGWANQLEQLSRKRLEGPGGQSDNKPEIYPHIKEGHQHPELHKHCHQVKESVPSSPPGIK